MEGGSWPTMRAASRAVQRSWPSFVPVAHKLLGRWHIIALTSGVDYARAMTKFHCNGEPIAHPEDIIPFLAAQERHWRKGRSAYELAHSWMGVDDIPCVVADVLATRPELAGVRLLALAIEWFEEAPDGRIIEDLVAWRRSVDGLENPIHSAYYRLLLITGFRKSEAQALRWRDVHPGRIHLPITKNGRPFDLPIVDIHHEILEPMRSLGREWVFPAPKSRSGHLECPKRIEWSPHAHRRTFATVAMESGILEEIVGRLLNHTPLSITGQRYARPSLDALRPAMQTICGALEQRIEGA